MVLTAYIALSPGTGLFCPRHPAASHQKSLWLWTPAFAGATLVAQFRRNKAAGQYLSNGLISICKKIRSKGVTRGGAEAFLAPHPDPK
jgi:hypothetical protein